MTRVVAVVAGIITALAVAMAMRDLLAHPVLARTNFRGTALPTAAGVVIVCGAVAVEGARAGLDAIGADRSYPLDRLVVLAGVIGFGLLGLIDDVLGDASGHGGDRGLRGHVRALGRGRVTSGMVKLLGGALLALVLAPIGGQTGWRFWVDAVVIAATANLANLFDRAPGRTIKVGVATAVPFLVLASAPSDRDIAWAVAVVVGLAIGLALDDLRERSMLGDTGANALGASVGLLIVASASVTARATTAAVVVALTMISERVSFSRVIERTPPLRVLDRLGRRP